MQLFEPALVDLLRWLKAAGYRFTAVTPSTHERVLARDAYRPATLRDIFGWSRAFSPAEAPADCLALMQRAGIVTEEGAARRSLLRVASLGDELFLHSAFPTDTDDAVFFGPDTYRFVRFLTAQMPRLERPQRIVDMGAGSGAGGLCVAALCPGARVELVDVNPAALLLARVNAAAAELDVETCEADAVPGGVDLIVANPPYMMDGKARAYRHGGDLLGGRVALDWTEQALATLQPGGALLLYTGASVTGGRIPLVEAIEARCAAAGATLDVDEIDPDVFGEELDEPDYAQVERIAALGITVRTRL